MKFYPYKQVSAVWLKAAVIGSLWASFEIIVGSFLHNLHVPFSGTALTFASVFLIIAFVQVWKDRGLVWRAGLICALMKSLSPSAVIIGPMIGILTEAIIIELFIRTTGRNLVSYILAGGVAVTSSLLHKLVSLLVLYGFNLVRIFEGIYQYAVRQLNLTRLDPVILIIVLVGIYFAVGAIASILGYFAGRNYRDKSLIKPPEDKISLKKEIPVLNPVSRRRYSMVLLFSHLIVIIITLWLINSRPYYFFIPVSIAYVAGCFAWYKNSLRRLRKISFWIQFMIITLLAAFLLEGYTSGNYFSTNGLVIGLKMNLRAFVIMVGFTAISMELKNPLIRSILYNRGFSSLYQSLSLAFSALPGIISAMPKSRHLFRRDSSLLSYLFSQSRSLMEQFEDDRQFHPPVIIVTGEVGKGKTTFTNDLAKKLINSGLKVSGFHSVGIQEKGQRVGFDLEDIQTGERMVIARKSPEEGWVGIGHYYFDPEIFKIEGDIILNQVKEGAELLIIDEIGPLELNDSGWSFLIETIIRQGNMPMIWVARKLLVKRVARKWNVGNVYIFDIEYDDEDRVLEILYRIMSKE